MKTETAQFLSAIFASVSAAAWSEYHWAAAASLTVYFTIMAIQYSNRPQ